MVGRFTDVVQHVPIAKAQDARAMVRDVGADAVLTVGGGSATGLGKAISLEVDVVHIAVPTTYAGSEMTTIWGLTDGDHKLTGKDVRVKPAVVIYDPELTLSLPPSIAGPSGMNALAHCVEALYGPGADPVTAVLALEGVRAIATSLPRVCVAPDDLDAGASTLFGAHLAGMSLAAGGTALHHKTCHVLGGMFNLDHGSMNAVVLGHTLAYNAPAIAEVMARLAAVLDVDDAAAGDVRPGRGDRCSTDLASIGMPADGLDEAARAHRHRGGGERAPARTRRHPGDVGRRLPRPPTQHAGPQPPGRQPPGRQLPGRPRQPPGPRRSGDPMTGPVFVIDAVRTPIGKIGGALADVRPDDLAAGVITALLERAPDLDPAGLDDVHFGNGNGAGEENRNVGRMAALLAGVPTSVPGVTHNRLCGSGLEAAIDASREIAVGDAELCIAGGVESMSRAPWVVAKPDRPYERGHQTMHSTTLGWRMVNPRHRKEWTVPLGDGAEILAERYAVSRREQDEFALRSHERAAAAWAGGRFDGEIVEAYGSELATDECVRGDATIESLAKLRPVFRPDGSVTAGNSSPMNDGAAAVLLGSDAASSAPAGRRWRGSCSRAVSGVDPDLFGIGPVVAAEVALERAGIGWADLSVVELNEAFAAQSLACLRDWPDLDPEIVNPNGGAITLGHPIGCSGARILTTLVHELERRGGYGLATMCIGVGQGIAMVVEAM